MQLSTESINRLKRFYDHNNSLIGHGVVDIRDNQSSFCLENDLGKLNLSHDELGGLRRLNVYAKSRYGFVVLSDSSTFIIAHVKGF